jgi:hypothetical protein
MFDLKGRIQGSGYLNKFQHNNLWSRVSFINTIQCMGK